MERYRKTLTMMILQKQSTNLLHMLLLYSKSCTGVSLIEMLDCAAGLGTINQNKSHIWLVRMTKQSLKPNCDGKRH